VRIIMRVVCIAILLGILIPAQVRQANARADDGGSKKFHAKEAFDASHSSNNQSLTCPYGAIAVQSAGGQWHC
jgi:hypothetical protein